GRGARRGAEWRGGGAGAPREPRWGAAGGGRSKHPIHRRRIEAERVPPPPRTAVSGHAPGLGRRLAQVGGRGFVRDDHPRRAPLLVLLAPLLEPAAHVLRVDLERVADVPEGE